MPYYPSVEAVLTETRFGVPELSCPNLYDSKIKNKIIVKIDLLKCLNATWGTECQIYREPLYKLLSGSCSIEEQKTLLSVYYRRYPKITEFVNNLFHYGNKDVPILNRVVNEVQPVIASYKDTVSTLVSDKGGKYLTYTHYYLYYAFNYMPDLSELEGVSFIC